MNLQEVGSLEGFVNLIDQSDGKKDSFLIMKNIFPDTLLTKKLKEEQGQKQADISRYKAKYGSLINLKIPKTLTVSRQNPAHPRYYIEKALKKLEPMSEKEIFCLGYYLYPIIKGNQKTRIFLLDYHFDGCQRFVYDESLKNGIDVTQYENRKKSKINGAMFFCKISHTEKRIRKKNTIKLSSVPVIQNENIREIIYSLESEFEQQPGNKFNEVKFQGVDYITQQRIRNSMTFYPQEIEAYLAAAKYSFENGNTIPWQMCPFFLPSKRFVSLWKKLNNNVIIYDKTITGPREIEKLRPLHIAEKCVLEARAFSLKTGLGYNECVYQKERDGKLEDFNWSFKS